MGQFEHYTEKGKSGDRNSDRGSRFKSRDSGFPDASRRRDFGFSRNPRGRASGFSGGSSGRDSRPGFGGGRFKKFKAVCSKCGEDCELPFVPTNHKPVFCSKCYRKEEYESKGRGSEGGDSSNKLDEINRKLDKIMKILGAE